MTESRLCQSYWRALIGNRSNAPRGRAGYPLWQRYWAALIGVRLPVRSELEILTERVSERFAPPRLIVESTNASRAKSRRVHSRGWIAATLAAVALLAFTWGIGRQTGALVEPSATTASPSQELSSPTMWRSVHLSVPVPQATSIAFGRDGEFLAVGTGAGKVQMLGPTAPELMTGYVSAASGTAIDSVALSPDQRVLATGSSDGSVRLWDVGTRRLLADLGKLDAAVTAVAFGAAGGRIVAAGGNQLMGWSVATGEPLAGLPLTVRGGPVHAVAFDLSEKVAVGIDDGSILLWDANAGTTLTRLTVAAQGGAVNTLAFSSDGRTLFSGSADGVVRLWDLLDDHPVGISLETHGSPVNSVASSPDGRWIASGTANGAVHLRRVLDSQSGRVLDTAKGSVLAVAFGRDSRQIAAVTSDGCVQMWNLS